MAQEQYADRLSMLPNAEAVAWAVENIEFDEYLIYRDEIYMDPLEERRKHGAKVTCTACGKSAIWPKVPGPQCFLGGSAPFGVMLAGKALTSGKKGTCPECGAKVELKHIGNIPSGINQCKWFTTIERLDDKIVLYCWVYQRDIAKNGSLASEIKPYEAYVFEARKAVRLSAYDKYFTSATFRNEWLQRTKCDDNYGPATNVAPWDPRILEGSTMENCKLDMYLTIKTKNTDLYPVAYMRMWQKHKNAENLLTAGAGRLIAEMIERKSRSYRGGYYCRLFATPDLKDYIDWKQKKPTKMIGLNRTELQTAVKDGWNVYDLEAYKYLRGFGVKLEDMTLVRKYNSLEVQWVQEEKPKVGIMRILRYLEKQKESIHTLKDYWNMARHENRNLDDMSLYLPRDLKHYHDQLTDLINERREQERKARDAKFRERQEKEKAERAANFARRSAEFSVFAWEHDGLMIRPVLDEDELIKEGAELSHCVSTYAARIAKKGESFIMVIRKTSEPEKPFFTLELAKDLTVVQNRGEKNCERTPKVKAFEQAWLEHIRSIGKKGSVA